MRFLHTADWHVGKKLGRVDRTPEFEAVLDELVEMAKDEKIECVLVAGDLLDRSLPSLDSISLVIDALLRLADVAGTVVAIPGNHDSAALFQMLARLLAPSGIILAPHIVKAAEGGVVKVTSRNGSESACVGVLPFLHEAQVVDFMKDSEEWFKGYASRIRLLSAALCDGFDSGGGGILMGHWFVDGAEIGGGERKIHMGQQYAATAQSIPPGADYVALGHIHRPQSIAGSAVPARYAGSLLQLDFSERTHTKEVVIVETRPGAPPKIKSNRLNSGKKLIRVQAPIEELQIRASSGEFHGAYVDVRVETSGPVFGLFDQVRNFLPDALLVQAVYERTLPGEGTVGSPADAALTDLYSGFHLLEHQVEAPPELIEALRRLEDELEGTVIAAT